MAYSSPDIPMASFLLCHECYTWVVPIDDRCPECTNAVDAATPDPSLPLLEHAIGEINGLIGEVRVRRPMLPERGLLYSTEGGLYFLPHELDHVTEMKPAAPTGSSLMWSAAALVVTPLIFVLPFVSVKRLKESSRPVYRPRYLNVGERRRPAELLMENPGVFFVPRRSIRDVRKRRRHWIVERIQGRSLRMTPDANRRTFHVRMGELSLLES